MPKVERPTVALRRGRPYCVPCRNPLFVDHAEIHHGLLRWYCITCSREQYVDLPRPALAVAQVPDGRRRTYRRRAGTAETEPAPMSA